VDITNLEAAIRSLYEELELQGKGEKSKRDVTLADGTEVKLRAHHNGDTITFYLSVAGITYEQFDALSSMILAAFPPKENTVASVEDENSFEFDFGLSVRGT
jgi:hypothetical protein